MSTGKESENRQGGHGRVMKYMGMFSGAQGFSMLLGIVKNKAAAKFLGTYGLGMMAMCNRTLQMISDATGLGLSFSGVRALSNAYAKSDSDVKRCIKVIRSIALFTGLLGMLLMLVVAPFINMWLFDGGEFFLLRLMLLSPVLLFMAVTNGELAVLRGTQNLARITIYITAIAIPTLLVSVPLYIFMGLDGIFLSIFLVALIQMCIILLLSSSLYRYESSPFSFSVLKEGSDIVKLGIGYMFVAMLSSLVLWLIYAILKSFGGNEVAGIFNAGFVIMMMLPGILFSAFDSEYYPRLASVISDKNKANVIVNEQVEVQLLVQSPLLMTFVAVMPFLVPLFYDTAFVPAISMAQIGMFGMFVRTLTYPLSYLSISKNETRLYVLLESAYNAILLFFVVAGYNMCGFIGVGAGMALAHVCDFLMLLMVATKRYGLKLSKSMWRIFFIQLTLFLCVIALSLQYESMPFLWLLSPIFLLLSFVVSIKKIREKVTVYGRLKNYIKKFLMIFKR